MRHDVRMDQGAACYCGHRVDGRNALSATAFCLSLRGGGGIETVRDVQGDGAAATESDHESGDDRDLARGALSCVGRSLVFGRLATRKTAAGVGAVRVPWLFFPLREGFQCRPQYPQPKILSLYQ